MAVVIYEKKKAHSAGAKPAKLAKASSGGNAKQTSGKVLKTGRSSSRKLLDGRIPHSGFSAKGTNKGFVVNGREVFTEVRTSEIPIKQIVNLNPAQSEVFPRLSGFALQFERYRFKSVTIEFYSACPATRSGALGIAVLTEFTPVSSDVPLFLPEFGSYEFSAVGAVSESMTTPTWRTKDPEMFFTGANGLSTSDPLKVFQGSVLLVTRDSVFNDNDTIAGYLAISYEVEFFNYRPTLRKVGLMGAPPGNAVVPHTTIPAGAVGTVSINLGGLVSSVGSHIVRTMSDWCTKSSNQFFGLNPTGWVGLRALTNYISSYVGLIKPVGTALGKPPGLKPAADQKSPLLDRRPSLDDCESAFEFVQTKDGTYCKVAVDSKGVKVNAASSLDPSMGQAVAGEVSEFWLNPACVPWRDGKDSSFYSFEDAVELTKSYKSKKALVPAVSGDYTYAVLATPLWASNKEAIVIGAVSGNAVGQADLRLALDYIIPKSVASDATPSNEEYMVTPTFSSSFAADLRGIDLYSFALVDKYNAQDGAATSNL